MREVVSKCDVDGSDEDVKTFTLGVDGQWVEVELCATHAKPLMRVIAKGRPSGPPVLTPVGRHAGGRRVRELDSRIRRAPITPAAAEEDD